MTEFLADCAELHRPPARGRQAVFRLVQHHPRCTFGHARQSEILGQSGRWQSEYHDAMIEHDNHVGALLDKLDELGIADNTIVIYSTDNGPHMNTWPDGGMTPFRGEKDTNWEGGFRVPALMRWPGKVPGRQRHQRNHQPPGLAAHPAGGGRRAGYQGKAQAGPPGGRQDLQGAPRRLQLSALLDRRGPERLRGRSSSTSPTTAI